MVSCGLYGVNMLLDEKNLKLFMFKLFSENEIGMVQIVGYTFNPFLHNDTFWCPWETSLLKTLWEKEKLLVTSNFSFSDSVFYPLDNFLPFSSNLKLSSANSFSLEESKICHLVMG